MARWGNLDEALELGSLRCLWVENDQNDAMAVDQWLLKATLQYLWRGSLNKQSFAGCDEDAFVASAAKTWLGLAPVRAEGPL